MKREGLLGTPLRLLTLVLLCALALQGFFALRILAMAFVDPASTAFQRSEMRRILLARGELPWRQEWVPGTRIAESLKRAVIASEDGGFTSHGGVDWEAIESAWSRNQRAERQAERQNERLNLRRQRQGAATPATPVEAKVIGGSTITQQLAKNLFLSGERHVLRKAQELVITLMLEAMLGKGRILEIYLNSVEWGEGVFGAQAAAQHYFRTDAQRLGAPQAARLAVMLPAPKRFEQRPGSPYLVSRTAVVLARMRDAELP